MRTLIVFASQAARTAWAQQVYVTPDAVRVRHGNSELIAVDDGVIEGRVVACAEDVERLRGIPRYDVVIEDESSAQRVRYQAPRHATLAGVCSLSTT